MSSVKRVGPGEAKELIDAGYTYVDVRSEPEFDAGHPLGALNVPIAHMTAGAMVSNHDFLSVMTAVFAKDTPLVVGCKAGGRSLRAAQMLLDAGFTDVIDQRAGFDGAPGAFGATDPGWSKLGLPVETGPTAGATYVEVKARGR